MRKKWERWWSNILQLTVLSVHLRSAGGFSLGAPTAACSADMKPRHGFAPQSTESPAELVVDRHTLPADQYLRVTLRSTRPIKGFLLKAESVTTADKENTEEGAFGSWYIPYLNDSSILSEARYLHCGTGQQNAVTHSGRTSSIYVVSFQWKPPEIYSGIIILRATVVLDYRTYWTDVSSPPITVLPAENEIKTDLDEDGNNLVDSSESVTIVPKTSIVVDANSIGVVEKDSENVVESDMESDTIKDTNNDTNNNDEATVTDPESENDITTISSENDIDDSFESQSATTYYKSILLTQRDRVKTDPPPTKASEEDTTTTTTTTTTTITIITEAPTTTWKESTTSEASAVVPSSTKRIRTTIVYEIARDVNEEASKDTHVYSSASDEDLIEIVPLDSQLEHPEHTNSDEDQNRRMDSGNQESNSEPEPESNPEPEPESNSESEPESDSEPESESEPGSDISQHEKELLDALSEISVPEIDLESLPELDLDPYSLEVNSSLRDRTPRLNEDDLSGEPYAKMNSDLGIWKNTGGNLQSSLFIHSFIVYIAVYPLYRLIV
ncbi:uncharacterized protein LOC111716220 isoform X2 [Eurytemora carolleeae]|uniref:uncharacterized protein LOC111716220 isoform X2 n=1 Tax=Eurytemora carolleeae TaxID=1294199 RepID=UPI000C787F18|nr:uncharacterized protein LOC111716220 isoform X2 [Eurytemora carolleeae]|eukprot:XP_023347428.1 uncharacterized protein LOC111716220 isoform X2 [Eurytemora affinis]